ncbi:hypothetical protein PUNSTDRAFT_47577 [Punctularia strigosozonata HHB-11173 SS5]|uniref:Uncharacterized protein n=1 Tax=Punctularia strigosozonata (strain HHB-11173) TaxID=741275 RepID=R7S1R3_PUNST|nr:uncharacterized protein PUNSTDRAFT_47577 [Punctularia strigosozonata HHB-11173 SS5]EIN04330.1 hypothetical protein PUNSTDRAFT_47577 [Punctularia strigosozonata HHB-11173 SS5]
MGELMAVQEELTNFVAKGWIPVQPDPDHHESTVEVAFVYTDHAFHICLQFTLRRFASGPDIDRDTYPYSIQYRPHAVHHIVDGVAHALDINIVQPYHKDVCCAIDVDADGAILFADIQRAVSAAGQSLGLRRSVGFDFERDTIPEEAICPRISEKNARGSRRLRSSTRDSVRASDPVQKSRMEEKEALVWERDMEAGYGMWWGLLRRDSEVPPPFVAAAAAQFKYFGATLMKREHVGEDADYRAAGLKRNVERYFVSLRYGRLRYDFRILFHGQYSSETASVRERMHYEPGSLHDALDRVPLPFPPEWPFAARLCLPRRRGMRFLLAELRRSLSWMATLPRQITTLHFHSSFPTAMHLSTATEYVDCRHDYYK